MNQEVKLSKIVGLKFNGEIVGVRAYLTDGDKFDVSTDALKKHKVRIAGVSESVKLLDINGRLVSEEEHISGNYAMDVSDDDEMVKSFGGLLVKKTNYDRGQQ